MGNHDTGMRRGITIHNSRILCDTSSCVRWWMTDSLRMRGVNWLQGREWRVWRVTEGKVLFPGILRGPLILGCTAITAKGGSELPWSPLRHCAGHTMQLFLSVDAVQTCQSLSSWFPIAQVS